MIVTFELRQAMDAQVEGILAMSSVRTQEISRPTVKSNKHGMLVLEAAHVTKVDPSGLMEDEKFTLGIGPAGSEPLASVSIRPDSGKVTYTLADPFKLQELIRADMPLNTALVNPRWFLEPLDIDAEGFKLVTDIAGNTMSKSNAAMVFETADDQSGIGGYIADIAGDLIQTNLVYTNVSRGFLRDDEVGFYLKATSSTHQRAVDEAPYKDVIRVQYTDNDIEFSIKSIKPNVELAIPGQLYVNATPEPYNGATASFGFDTKYLITKSKDPDVPNDVSVATKTYSRPYPADMPPIQHPMAEALRRVNERLAGAALEMFFAPEEALD